MERKNEEFILNRIEEWEGLIEKTVDEGNGLIDELELTVILEDKHQLSNLAYLLILKNHVKKIKVNIKKNIELRNWRDTDFSFELRALFHNIENDNIVINIMNENDKIEKIKKVNGNYNFKSTLPILIFEKKDLEYLKTTVSTFLKNYDNGVDETIISSSIIFLRKYIEKFLKIQNNENKIEFIKKYENSFNLLTMFVFIYLFSMLDTEDEIEIRDLANEIQCFSFGLYQIIENSCFHSEGKEAIVILSYLNFSKYAKRKFDTYYTDFLHDTEKKKLFFEKFSFLLDEDKYLFIRLIDDAYKHNEGIKSLIEKASNISTETYKYLTKEKKERLLYNYIQSKNSLITDSQNNTQKDKVAEQYGILTYLKTGNTLKTQGIVASGNDRVYINNTNHIIGHQNVFDWPLKNNKYVTEYIYVVPIKPIFKSVEKMYYTNNIRILDYDGELETLDYNFSNNEFEYDNQSQKKKRVENLSHDLINKYKEKQILNIYVDEKVDIEILVKSIANVIYTFIENEVFISLNFVGNKQNNKNRIREFIFYYKMLNIKLNNLVKERRYIEHNIQISFFIIDEKKENVYVSTMVGVDWDVIIKSFINNLLYNNEFIINDFFDLYIEDISLSNPNNNVEILVLPFDLYIQKNAQYFINKVDSIIDSESITHDNVNVLLGSGIYLKKFFEAEYVFQSKYLTSRFALLIKNDLIKEERELAKYNNITIVGYASYSHLLGEELRKLLSDKYKDKNITYIYFEHSGLSFEELSEINIGRERSYYIAIIPIASTLNTIFKMNKLLSCLLLHDEDEFILNRIYNILTVNPVKKVPLHKKISAADPIFKNIDMEYRNKTIKVRSLLTKEVSYSDEADLLPVSMLDKTSTLQDSIYNIESDLSKKDSEEEILEYNKENFKKFKYLLNAIKYGHYELNNKHYLFYINCDKIFESIIKNRFIENIENELKKIQINCLALNIVISPLSANNHNFLSLVMKNTFSGNVLLIQFNKNRTYRENFLHKYNHIKERIKKVICSASNSVVNFYFVDTTIASGKTFNRAKELVNVLISDIKHEYPVRFKHRIFEKTFLLINRSSKNTIETLMDDEKNVYRYININCPSFDMNGVKCHDCKITDNYLKLSSILSYTEYSKYWRKKAEEHKAEVIKNKNDLNYNVDDFLRLCITHLLIERKKELECIYIDYINSKIDENMCYNLIEDIRDKISKQISLIYNNPDEEKYIELFIRVISRPFITSYESIKQISFIYLKKLLEKKKNIYTDKLLMMIINRLSYLGTNYLNKLSENEIYFAKKSDEFKNNFNRALCFEKACSKGIIK